MAYKQKYGIGHLPRPRHADWAPPAEQSAWAVREEILKREAAERAAAEAASAALKAAAEVAKAKAAADITPNTNAAPVRHSVSAHFD